MNLTKSLPISLRQGIRVPQYGDKLRMEHIRGTIKRASSERTSKARLIMYLSWFVVPMIPGQRVSKLSD
jgi:hypothetical protein